MVSVTLWGTVRETARRYSCDTTVNPASRSEDRVSEREPQGANGGTRERRAWSTERRPDDDGDPEDDADDTEQCVPGQPATGREQERDRDDLGRGEKIGGEEEPDRGPQPQAG